MIDLSFLTEEEQEAIMKVLQRDAELKKAEEERVRHLPEKVKDDVQLKNMSGQWFYEAKSKRHRDKIHGADIIRASMRRKPATLAEMSQSKSNKAKDSWVSNVNKEVFALPELHGIVEHQEEDEELKSNSSSNPVTSLLDKPDRRSVKAAASTIKQRRNPFNSTISSDNLNSEEPESTQAILPQLSNKEILLPSEEKQPKANSLNDEMETSKKPSEEPTEESQKGPFKRPVPKARKLVHKVTNPVPQGEDFFPKPAKRTQGVNGIGILPRGILKRSSSSSSTDSDVRANQVFDVQSKNGIPTTSILEGEANRNSLMEEAEDSTQISLEKLKQVRFSSSIGKGEPLQSPRLHHRREKRESDLLKSGEVKTSENDANRSDSFKNKQTSTVKPLETHSSALQVKTRDSLQEDMSASSLNGTNESVFLVNQTLQTKTITPKKLEIPEKNSTNILPKNKNEQNVDQTCENNSKFLSHESKSLKNFTDEHLLSAETKTQELSDINSAGLQQGKPDLVEERDAKTVFKPDKHGDEIVEVADESVSEVLDWFERSSGTEDRKTESARSQGGELKEVNFTTRTVLPTEHSGTSVDRKMQAREELPSGKNKQLNAISPTTFISENRQLIKERRKPKQGKENEEQNEKSLSEFDYTRIEAKESDEEIKQQNQINVLKHHEHVLPAQKCVLEKAVKAKRRIREIRAFWERHETIPSHGEKEVDIHTNTSSGGALEGLKESNKIKPTALYLPYGLDDQSKSTLNGELRCAIQASKNEHQNSFEFGPGHAVKKTEKTLPCEGKLNEYTKLTKDSILQSGVGVTSASPEIKDKDGKETFKGKVAAFSQQKPSFQALSFKEKNNEMSQISSPSQFQSLRNFWDTRVKLQNSIDREDVSSSNNAIHNNTFITYGRNAEEGKGRDIVSKQKLSQHQTQASEEEKMGKSDSVVCKPPVGFLTFRGLNVTPTESKDTVQLVKKPIISQPHEKTGLQRQEVKEHIDKNIVSSKEHPFRGSRRSSEQNLPREIIAYQPSELGVGMKTIDTVNNTAQTNCSVDLTSQQDTGLSEDVTETIEKSLAPSKVNGLSLENLVREVSDTPSSNPRHAGSAGQRTAEMQAKNTKYEQDEESLQEISETVEKSVAPSKVSSLSSSLEKLLKEASETPPPKPRRVDVTVQRAAEMEVKNTTCQHDGESLQEIIETIEKSDAPTKVSGLSSALEKLLKEASETPPPKPRRTLLRTAEVQAKSTKYQQDEESLQEISETIQKSVVPSKLSSLSSSLEKLLREASETPPPKPRRVDMTVQRIAEMEVKNTACQHDGETLQEISETIEKSVAPSRDSGLSSSLEKLLKEASETPPPKPRRMDDTVQRTADMQVGNMSCHHSGDLLQETSALSEAKNKALDVNFQKVLKDICDTPASTLENMDKKMQGKIPTSWSMCMPHQGGDHPQEIQETIEKTTVSNSEKFKEFSSSVEKLLQEASKASSPISKAINKQEKFGNRVFPSQTETLVMTVSQSYDNALRSCHKQMKTAIKSGVPEQNVKASVVDLATSEVSELLKINEAIIKKEQRNTPAIDLPSLQGQTNIVIKPFKINEIGRGDESTSLNASEDNSQLKELLKLRTSTPLKDESSSPQLEGAQFSLAFQHEDNDEEDGDSLNFGSQLSDENSDYYSGTGSSIRSEEELNPVLMALKRSADRKMPSKSLEDIPSATSNKGKINIPKEELALSAEDVSTVPSQPDKPFSNPEKVKGLSKSVPSFLQEESDDRETDTASESSYSFDRIKKSPSSLTNLSGSSGMASLSSVSGSLMSVYSGDFGSVDVKGNIQFAIDYVEQLNELHIFICQCKDLAVADVKRQRSDPYVKTYLLPEKYKLGKRKTSVKKKTFNPVFNEILRYKIEKDLLKNQTLNISVWHNDTFGRNSFLGEVELDLGTWDWNDKSNKQINWFPLKPRTSAMAFELENRGKMKLALQYVPQPVGGKKILSTGEVHIWVKECRGLPLLRGNRLNSFIKCTILPDTSRKSRQKTRTVSKTTNPVFNHTMVYDGFRPEDLKEACIELTVWDHNKLVNHFLGGLRIGLGTGKSYGTTVDWMDSTSDESALWEKMIKSPNTWVEDTLPLRMLMVAKLTK
ncbi:synaptotagmin-like protein 2 isoform X2 [Phasianus colchicus]|uniref:synaptotagmin-like protein 2 isoform X2 n=1 Tax=Phasianus colchicus TaxID=9054 RepID=UPI00129D48A1|nr:synaptotagmin-like protein 2 isoform X2 [Phasianus colchicus]